MGGATRFMTLITTPIPPLRSSFILLHRRISSLPTTPLRLLALSSPSKIKIKTQTPQLVSAFHSQPINNTYTVHSSVAQQQQHHPWQEWTNFLNILSNGQGFSAPEDQEIPPEDAFVVYEELSDDFVRAAAACMALARARPNLLGSLSRKDIEAVVSNGTPFLFKSALDTARRMRAFLESDEKNVSGFDKANTIDLMKYILSYASNPTVSPERSGLYSRELIDSSVRNLLHELGTICSGVPTGNMQTSGHQFSGRVGQYPKPFGQNIEMKRGDWICPKCNFMNFARNMKCLECEESRPKRQLIGGEWDCPQCNFFNYGRNVACLRCDCRRPGAPLFNNSQSGSGYNRDISYKTNSDDRSPRNEEKAQQWFNKIAQMNNANNMNSTPDKVDLSHQIDVHNKEKLDEAEKSENWFKKMSELHNVKDLPNAVSDEDFPEIMPMRKGENRFVVSKKKDRSLTSPKYKRQVAVDQGENSNFTPFVPFPPGYFDRKDTSQPGSAAPASTAPMKDQEPTNPIPNQTTTSSSKFSGADVAPSAETRNVGTNENARSSLEGSAVKETDPLDMSEEAKAERWFKRVAQIKDISELSQIPDEDFPSIMPMRKGVNRFVVSKRKTPLERRLTSQQYRRNLPIVSNDSVRKESDNN